jgi:DNA-directed RNA polymerase subunit RPC12/RpoP
MVAHPLNDTAEVEITCPRGGYRVMRKAARLGREIEIRCPACGEAIAPGIGEAARNKSSGRNDR